MADGLIWTTDQWRAERLSSTPSDKYKYTKQDPTWQTKRSLLLDQTTVAPRRLPSAQLPARRVPAASTDGQHISSTPNSGTPTRRRRVFIVSEEEQQMHTGRPAARPSRAEHSNYDGSYSSSVERSRYEERYQAERADGRYSYNYNRSERPHRSAAPGHPGEGQPHKGKYAGKGPKKGGPSAAPKAKKKKKQPQLPVPVKYEEIVDPSQDLRLNKFLANAGVCSRREADALIAAGEITVNGVVVTELGSRVTRLDEVMYKGMRVSTQSKVYILLNKPKNCVTTSDDPECRRTVMDLVKGACEERIYPVGRLDRNTTGVILITNDGDLSSKLTHPSFMKKKIYHAWLDKPVSVEDMQRIAEGIELEDGEIHADALSYVSEEDLSQVGIEIHSGRNRIVRRIFEHLGYHVVKLDRVYFAGLTKKNLPRGRWRYLTEQEVNNLRMGSFE
ncbi:pseudouridylate synthase [Porphyromonas sp. KLE 1280]|nr:pseudouridylate synthase [Porphyromonas sp. KLE 1280]